MSQRLRYHTLPDGTVIFDIIGADSGNEDEGDDDEDDDADDDNDEDESDEDEDEDEDDVEKLKADLAAAEKARAKADRRMRAADRAKIAAVNELNALKQGGKKELADAQEKITELQAKLDAAAGTDSTALIREEFRDLADFAWHDPKVAFSLLDLAEVHVENGKVDVDALKDAAEDLAKEKPFLVKKAEKPGDGDEDEDESDRKPKPKSGQHQRRQNPNTKRQKALTDKFRMGGRI